MSRATWKVYYRALRVCRREAGKAYIDALMYGVGYVRVTPGADPEHVPSILVMDDDLRGMVYPLAD